MENYRGAPGRQCSICSHPEVGAIQRAVGEGVPLLDACSRYGGAIKKSALHRHMQNHTGRQYRTETASRKTVIASDYSVATRNGQDRYVWVRFPLAFRPFDFDD